MTPLESDPKRQAIPTLKGYSYQIWQSLLRWIELEENQNLYLEGAEDIDILGPESAETVQVKETAESVTLRSPDILEAIENLWQHKKNNSTIEISFRFLTTSERGKERPAIVEKIRGLDLWDSCKNSGTNNKKLRKFLIEQKTKLSKDLREFIKTASDGELRAKLLTRVEWDTGKKTQPFVESVVRRKIVEYGDKVYGLPPFESEKVIPHLLQYVWNVVRRSENRWLTRSDFLTEFEKATTIRISVHELQKLKRARKIESNPNSIFNEDTRGRIRFDEVILEHLSLPDTSKFAGRVNLVIKLKEKLNETSFLVLTGSTGIGKSQLSYKIAAFNDENDGDSDTWRKLDLRGLTPEQIKDRLNYASLLIEDNISRIDCLIDDLNFDDRPNVYENALGRLLYAVRIRGGRILITSHQKLPIRLTNLYDIKGDSFVAVPPLTEDDVRDLVARNNCPSGHKLKAWSRLIFLQMRGHPLLTHTRIRSLANEGWVAIPSEEDLTSVTEEIKDIRQEFRRNLRNQLPEDARTLLYRLSVFAHRFKRRHALHIGSHSPRISTTGEAFDMLVGPWIEQLDETYYRLSSLLDNAASEVFTEAEIKELHKAAADSFIESDISVIELDALLFHGLLSEEPEPLIAAAMSVFSIERSGWEEIARFSGWFAYAKLDKQGGLFPGNQLVNFLLRRMQFKIMSVFDQQKAVEVVQLIERELIEWDGSDVYPAGKTSLIFPFLNDVLFELAIPFSIRQIVKWVLQAIPLAKTPESFFPEHVELQNDLEERLSFLSSAIIYVRVATARCRTRESVIELLNAFDESPTEAAQDVWNVFKTDVLVATTLADAVWLGEIRKEDTESDWTSCLETLDEVIEIATRRNATALVGAAYQAKAIIYEEYIKDTEKALKVLEEGEEVLGGTQIALQDYRAKTFFLEKKYSEALDIWRQILPIASTDRNAARSFSFREAEICAARLGNWGDAADFALRGEEAALLPWFEGQPPETPKNVISETMAVGFRADYAFALWKLGERAKAVEEFTRIFDSFQNLPDPADDFGVLMLYKRVGYAVLWFLKNIEGNTGLEEPEAGFFSNPKKVEEVKNTPHVTLKNYWYVLAQIEDRLRLGDTILRRLEKEVDEVRGDESNIGFHNLVIKQSLRKCSCENLINQFLELSRAIKSFVPKVEGAKIDVNALNDSESLKHLTFTALMIYLSRGQQHLVPLEDWKRDSIFLENKENAQNSSLSNWINLISESLSADRQKLIHTLTVQIDDSERRILAALLLSAADDIDVETRFYANMILLTADFSGDWRDEAQDIIEFWIANKWKRIAESEKFSLQTPKISAPAILTACNDHTYKGLSKAANILLAARDAVRSNINESITKALRSLVEKRH